jgi:hypothetical protein
VACSKHAIHRYGEGIKRKLMTERWISEDGLYYRDYVDGEWKLIAQEKDPNGKSQHEPGAKLDTGKSPVYQGLLDYFPRACLAVADVSAAGARKYAWKGWESVPDGIKRYGDALGRHIVNESIEGKFDSEGFRHAAQIAWNALARLELILKEEENDKKAV